MEQAKNLKMAVDREAKAQEGAPTRWNAAIDFSSAEFKAKYDEFSAAVRDPNKTVRDVLEENFTAHERAILYPVEKSTNRALYSIQIDNRSRYKALLQSERFQGWAGETDLPFKLTLVHYGLPVAPMTVDFKQRFTILDDDTDQDDEDPKEPNGGSLKGHLRFLNNFNVRHFGKDNSLRNPDPLYESYYA